MRNGAGSSGINVPSRLWTIDIIWRAVSVFVISTAGIVISYSTGGKRTILSRKIMSMMKPECALVAAT